MKHVGQSGSRALFSDDVNGVVVDLDENVVVETGALSTLIASAKWKPALTEQSPVATELAEAALAFLDVSVVAAGSRLYTIPKAAQAEAKRGLEWRKEHNRGGTPVGVNSARTLAKGGQIGIEKVRHIAKYFPRHEIDKKAKGYEPGEDGFPSRGRIAWALWGGDAAWRWARAIVERENKKALKADGYADMGYVADPFDFVADNNYDADLDAFSSKNGAVEFLARLRMDGSGIDRLYKVDEDLIVSVWDSGSWHMLDGVSPDLASYDLALDDESDTTDKVHIEIDPESALFLSASFQEDAYRPVSLFDIDYDEASMILAAAAELDYDFLDSIVAVGAEVEGDGFYSPEERREDVKNQPRQKGRFGKKTRAKLVRSSSPAAPGAPVVPGVPTPPAAEKPKYSAGQGQAPDQQPLDTSGILAQPRTPIDRPYAQLPGTLPRMGADDIAQVQNDWPGFVKDQRDKYEAGKPVVKPGSKLITGPGQTKEYEKPDFLKELEELTGVKMITDPYKHPLLEKFLNKKVKGADGKYYYPNKLYYQPAVPKVTSEEAPAAKEDSAKSSAPAADTKAAKSASADVQAGETSDNIGPDGKAGKKLQSFTDPDTNRVRTQYTDGKNSWWGEKGTITPAGYEMYEDGSVAPKDPKNPPKGSYDPSKTGPDGQASKLVKTFTDKFTGRKIAKYSDGKSVWFGRVKPGSTGADLVAPGFKMNEDGSLSRNTKSVTAAGKPDDDKQMTPETSDVQPVFFAVVSEDDPGAVLDLVSLVPAATDSTAPMTYTREDKKWVRNEALLVDMNSPTPPPVVPLDAGSLKSVIEQVDGTAPVAASANPDKDFITVLWGAGNNIMFLTAAGGPDRNRGNAEQLRRYWTVGKGGLVKIRWNTPGDWTRCYRNLKKYMGPRAKGYCSLRHKEMTGMWPGDKDNPGMKKGVFAMDEILSSEQVIEASALSARAKDARNRVLKASAEITLEDGGKFSIPLVIPEDLESGDGRRFKKGAIEIRELPLPLMWQIKSAEGHNGSVVVGRIDHMERVENGIGNATGVFDQGEYGQEAERLVRNGFIRGVSADLDQFEASEERADLSEEEDSGKIGADKLVITHARVMAVTLVPKPAFQECQIYLVEDEKQEDIVIPDGVYVDEMDPVEASALVACGVVAGAIPVTPPREWFIDPKLQKATPLTVDDEGRVFGHIAAWHVDHIGMSFGTKPPRSRSKYAYFHTGVVRAGDGTDVPVGQLTLAGGHASLEASAAEAVRHYDDTASAIADVHAGEDAYGIWVAGALRPGTTPEQVRALRASAPSGDWRPIKGQLELVAVCQVNVPGFPIARARVASGAVMALVAAGANVLARMKSDPVAELSARVHKLEQLENAELSIKADEARAKFADIRESKAAELSVKADAAYARIHGEPRYDDEFGYISREKRQKLAKEGKALPDGSYPITTVDSLKDSIQAYGRSKPGKRAAVRRHIMKRARALDKADLIPEEWKKASASLIEEDLNDLRARLTAFAPIEAPEADEVGKAPAVEVKAQGKYNPDTQPRDAKGKFRDVLARIKNNLGDGGSEEAIKKIEETENLDDAGNYMEAARSAGDLISIIDRLDTGALNKVSLENVRSSAGELGRVIANLPLPFGSDTEKVRYSDLPPALKGLMDDMIARVENKIGQKDADEATKDLRSFMSGGDYYSQAEISSQMSKLLRLLT
jgi:hypothetical protein